MMKKLFLGLACALLLPLGISSCGGDSSISSSLPSSVEASTGETSSTTQEVTDYCKLTTNFDNQVGGKVDYEVKHANGNVVSKSNYDKLVTGDVIYIKSVKANDGYKATSLLYKVVLKNDGGHSESDLNLDLVTPSGVELTTIELEVEENAESISLEVTFTKNA